MGRTNERREQPVRRRRHIFSAAATKARLGGTDACEGEQCERAPLPSGEALAQHRHCERARGRDSRDLEDDLVEQSACVWKKTAIGSAHDSHMQRAWQPEK